MARTISKHVVAIIEELDASLTLTVVTPCGIEIAKERGREVRLVHRKKQASRTALVMLPVRCPIIEDLRRGLITKRAGKPLFSYRHLLEAVMPARTMASIRRSLSLPT